MIESFFHTLKVELLEILDGIFKIARRIEDGLNQAMSALARYPDTMRLILERYQEVRDEAAKLAGDAIAPLRRVGDARPATCEDGKVTMELLDTRDRWLEYDGEQTIEVLRHAKQHRPEVLTKTSLMLGLGERDNEIMQTMDDLREAGVDILTLGQYLRPTPNHLAVERYVTPDEFDLYRREGLEKGFLEVVAGPMVRSSYRAEQVLQKNNVGLAV